MSGKQPPEVTGTEDAVVIGFFGSTSCVVEGREELGLRRSPSRSLLRHMRLNIMGT